MLALYIARRQLSEDEVFDEETGIYYENAEELCEWEPIETIRQSGEETTDQVTERAYDKLEYYGDKYPDWIWDIKPNEPFERTY